MAKKAIVIFDNGGQTADRYTGVITKTGDVVGFNEMPFHPAYGFGQYCWNICDRMNITYGHGWRNRFSEKKILKTELANYLNEAKNNPEWLGKEVELTSLSADAQQYVNQILSE
jgi:hypothetical protein